MLTKEQNRRIVMNVPVGRLVECRVLVHFNLNGAESPAFVGDTIHVLPDRAVEFDQNGWVQVQLNGHDAVTIADPDYVEPPEPPTATIRVRIPSQHRPVGESEARHFEPGSVVTVLESDAVIACADVFVGNPQAERVG